MYLLILPSRTEMQCLLAIALFIHIARSLESVSCNFNSMCTCNFESETQKVSDISCIAVPLYKFPNLRDVSISHMEIQGSNIMSLERTTFSGGVQIRSLTAANNKLQSISEKSFSSMSDILSSLDLSYNKLNSVPYSAIQDLKNLQWLNLYGNNIHSVVGEWSNLKYTVANLFLGGNDISEIPADTDHMSRSHGLHRFKSLIWLNLDSNRISKLSKHSLSAGLQTLSVSHNLLASIPHELLAEMPHLQWLYLRDNHISFIPDYTFPRNVRLEKIDMSENALRSLPRHPFNNSLYVRDLNLAFNSVRSLLSDSFQGLECGRIILAHNEIESVDRKAFAGLNETLEYLDFDHNHLIHIPYALNHLAQLKYLYLSSNLITNIPENAFQVFSSKLKALSVSGNRLNTIPTDALSNCSELSYLNIGYNEIYEIFESDFDWAENLKTLLLRNNRLIHLKEQLFAKLKSLKELSLSFNPLRYIDTNAFDGLAELDSLEISFSLDWEEFPQDILKPLVNLQWLTMDNNNFKTISEHGLSDVSQLRYLNLEGNKLELIPVNLFRSTFHSCLTDVRLSNNNLEIILSDTFHSIHTLKTIILAGNKIRSLQRNSFSNMTNLTTLVLCDNVINQISPQAFANLPNFHTLDLHANKLSEFSFKVFTNVSNFSPLILNVSQNFISFCESDNKIVNIEVFDMSVNNLLHVPRCLENVSALKKLLLDFNSISALGHNTFMHLTSLEILQLKRNNVSSVHKQALFGLQNLQLLDLSQNYITTIHAGQFSSTPRLRVLNLSHNRLNYLPKDAFSGAALEMLDLSYNSFNVVPSLSLTEVGNTLRHLAVSSNNIEHVDSTTFPDIPHVQHLDLSNNKLTILPDNVFTSLGLLQRLDLSSNTLRANFKELFHYAQSLKELHLYNTGITSLPHLPLPNLVYLNVSFNNIDRISKTSTQELHELKYLYLNYNKLTTIPVHVWPHVPLLKTLDLSYNPLKEIGFGSFSGLHNIQTLNINHLKHVQKFESKSIMQLPLLSSLTMQTWPNLDNFRTQFCFLLANLTRLRVLKLQMTESVLNDQLKCVSSSKMKYIQISGENLKYIDRDVFAKFTRNPELLIRITNTQIEELPVGLFSGFDKISHLTIDLRNNMLTYLSPDIFYTNATSWKNVGTTLISGGLLVSNNQWKCGCHLAWLGHWLRRWARESLQAHTAPVNTVIRVNELLKEATCINLRTGKHVPIVKLSAEDMSCHASALSAATCAQENSIFISIVVVVYRLSKTLFSGHCFRYI